MPDSRVKGNREEAAKNGSTTYYCANELNQYTYTGTTQITCPPQMPTLTYDADGNLTNDGQFTYTWDGENRLIAVEPAGTPSNGDKKVAFKYDYMNRRVEKTVWTYNSGWGNPTQVLRFVYDKWNVVLVLDGLDDNAVLTKYTWGLDLSGQRGNPTASGIHSAGGVGGLLAVEETATQNTPKYWFLYDANGNIGQAIENTTAYPVAAHYEYDAYGNVLGTPTGYAAANPFRFSTKWLDSEIGLYYYGYRYYMPRLGRWLNRDPSGESGGLNLCSFAGNDGIARIDPLGLDWIDNLADFMAGVGDSLSFGLSRQVRKAISWGVLDDGYRDAQVNPRGGYYTAGEVVEVTVEIAVTAGGASLRYVAKRASREVLEGTGKKNARLLFREAHELEGGVVHHINPIRGHIGGQIARYPLPFKWAAHGHWNMRHMTHAQHVASHRWMRNLEALDRLILQR